MSHSDDKKLPGEVRTYDIYTESVLEDGTASGVDRVYHSKARLLNDAVQEIGMGKYQWMLFFVAGFGWFADNLWPVKVSGSGSLIYG